MSGTRRLAAIPHASQGGFPRPGRGGVRPFRPRPHNRQSRTRRRVEPIADGVGAAPFLRVFSPILEEFRPDFRGAESRTIPSPGRLTRCKISAGRGSALLGSL